MSDSKSIQVKCACDNLVKLNDLKPHPSNRNKHPADQINRLSKLIKYNGIRHPIIVSKRSGFIVAGHGRLAAARLLELDNFPVEYQDFDSDEAEYSFLQSDNAIALWAELDLETIQKDVLYFKDSFDVDWLGFKDFKLNFGDSSNDEKEEKERSDPESEFEHECPSCGFQF